jgi:PhoPQ-activated pathogenicity-related protein
MRPSVRLLPALLLLGACLQAQPPRKPVDAASALQAYLSNEDASYAWAPRDTFSIGDVTVHSILLTSQTWRGIPWKHQLSIAVPKDLRHDTALLFITGSGMDKDGNPKWSGKNDRLGASIAMIAGRNHAVTAVLKQVPVQPLFDGRTEDALISYTLDAFRKDGDYTWPLLFPMVKSAQRAMDCVQEFLTKRIGRGIRRFVVSGASKRGWTTWLTAAHDDRVVAFAPMVIDMLNMPVSMKYQLESWNAFSEQIQDYVKLGIVQEMASAKGDQITRMIDPYRYRHLMDKPKLLVMGTNDAYWPIDNVRHYIDDIPGRNLLYYVPNVGHNLGTGIEAVNALSAFFANTLQGGAYPGCDWKARLRRRTVSLTLKASGDRLEDVVLWQARSDDRDFRNEKWTSRSLGIAGKARISLEQPLPEKGYAAFYCDLRYRDPSGNPYQVSTRVFLTDTVRLF